MNLKKFQHDEKVYIVRVLLVKGMKIKFLWDYYWIWDGEEKDYVGAFH